MSYSRTCLNKQSIENYATSEENITNTVDTSSVNILSEEEFQRYSVLRDQELETHFQHLKIETTEE